MPQQARRMMCALTSVTLVYTNSGCSSTTEVGPTANDSCIFAFSATVSVRGTITLAATVGDTVEARVRRDPLCVPAPKTAYLWEIRTPAKLTLLTQPDSTVTVIARDTGLAVMIIRHPEGIWAAPIGLQIVAR